MSVTDLTSFFQYTPILEDNPQYIVDKIKEKASDYLSSEHIQKIQSTYEYAREKHSGQIRQSGEHYISHIVQATQFLMTINPDLETIQACLLHDVIEDCNVSPEDIEQQF